MRDRAGESPFGSLASALVAAGLLALAALTVSLLVSPISGRVSHAGLAAQVSAALIVTLSRLDGVQRAMGRGRIDGRPVLRTLVGCTLLGVALVTFEAPSLFPIGAAMVVTVHVQWSGARFWVIGAAIAVAGTVVVQTACHLGWIPTPLTLPMSDRITALALLLSVGVMGNAGLIARQRETEAAAAEAARQLRQSELLHAAAHDALTGLLGRAGLTDRLGDAAAVAAPGSGSAVLFLDLDGFKSINDTHGHDTGDRVLVAAAGRLRQALRTQDDLARTGGDEFVVVMTAVPERETASSTADRLEQALTEPIEVGGLLITVGVSVGWVYADAPSTGEDLLRAADAAMYAVKRRHHEQRHQVTS